MSIQCCQCGQPLQEYSCLSLNSLRFYFSLAAYLRCERPPLGQSSSALCLACYDVISSKQGLSQFAEAQKSANVAGWA